MRKLILQRKLLHAALCATLIAPAAWATSLETVVQQALGHDAVFAEAQARYEAAQQKLPQARAGLLPTLALTGNSYYNRDGVDNRTLQNSNDWHYNSNAYALTLTQPLYRYQNWLGYDQAELQVALAELAYRNARQELVLRAAQAYFDVLQAHDSLTAAQAYQQSVTAQLDFARKAYASGTGIQTDVFDAESRAEIASSQVLAAETDLEVRNQTLQNITGEALPPQERSRGKALVLPPLQPREQGKWVEAAQLQNLLVKQQELALEVAGQEVRRQRAGHYPTIDLVASTGRNSALSSGQREITDNSRVGVQLTVPIFEGGLTSARTTEAVANKSASQAALEAARRNAALVSRQAYLGVVNGLNQIKAMAAAHAAAQRAVVSNKDAFDMGVRLGMDVLNAQNQVYLTRRDLTRVIVETLLAQLRLKAAIGSLEEQDVQLIDAALKP